MAGNIRNSVEVVVSIEDSDVKIRKLYAAGEYLKVKNKNNYNFQEELMKNDILSFQN